MTLFEIAHRLLSEYEESGKYVNLSLNSHITDTLSKEERGRLTALLYGAVEKKITYDYYICALSGRSMDKISPSVRDALRLGFCALVDMRGIAEYAAVNECVKLVKNAGERSFVNAILRRAAREKKNLPLPDKNKNPIRYYSVYYSLPQPTVKYMINLLSEESALGFFEAVNARHEKTALTVNTLKISVDGFIEKLKKQGYDATRVKNSPISVEVSGAFNPKEIPGFFDGEFFVQDSASAMAAMTLDLKAGERAVDVCSAPGGKSFALAILSKNKADVRAFDIHESKLSLITAGAERLSLSSIKAEVRDALSPFCELFGTVDKVLCDVPCSGLGVIGKKPDLRYKDITDLEQLSKLQIEILSASSKYLKPGGTLVYSTCTLRREENEDVVFAFLSSHPDFVREDFDLGYIKSENGSVTLYPHIHATDGFFIQKLRKKK